MSHEKTITVEMDGRHFNIPTVGHRSGKPLTQKQAIKRARDSGQLGRGFATQESAVKAAKARSESSDKGFSGKDPAKTGGRVRSREKLIGSTRPFNPGGQPRGRSSSKRKKGK